jgi:ferrous-iron efflux pump FieF
MKKTYSPLAKAALMSLALTVAKLIAFFLTGSLVVLSSALDSLIDSVMSLSNSYAQRLSRTRPDREHPFGHGGFEVVASFAQGALMIGAAVYLSMAAISRLNAGHEVFDESMMLISIATLLFAAIGSGFIQIYLRREEERLAKGVERSLAVTADRAHYLGDVWMNVASALGLAVVWFTGRAELDAVFALAGAAFLLKSAFPVLKHCIKDIVHYEIDPALQQRIVDIALAADPRVKGIHRLRSRELGPTRFVDFHMALPADMSLQAAHNLGEKVTMAIKRNIPQVDVMIHLDPETEPPDDLWEPGYDGTKNQN